MFMVGEEMKETAVCRNKGSHFRIDDDIVRMVGKMKESHNLTTQKVA